MWSKEAPTKPGLYLVYLKVYYSQEKWGESEHKLELMKVEFFNDPQQGFYNELFFYPQAIQWAGSVPVYTRESLMARECLFCKFDIPIIGK